MIETSRLAGSVIIAEHHRGPRLGGRRETSAGCLDQRSKKSSEVAAETANGSRIRSIVATCGSTSDHCGAVANAHLRAAQAYMLISMPTGTSMIFGVLRVISDLLSPGRRVAVRNTDTAELKIASGHSACPISRMLVPVRMTGLALQDVNRTGIAGVNVWLHRARPHFQVAQHGADRASLQLALGFGTIEPHCIKRRHLVKKTLLR
jgi:hypothetical protein